MGGVAAGARGGGEQELWTRVRSELLARPSLSHGEIAQTLQKDAKFRAKWPDFDAAQIDRLLGKFGKRETWAERDRALAEKLAARIAKLPEDTPLATMARQVGDVLPGLADHDLKRLIRRHPDLLGHVGARAMHAPVPPAVRARIEALALAHPTLDHAALAELFAADPKIGQALPWSEQEVSRLREPSRILPSDRRRAAALAELATEHLNRVKKGTSLDQAISSLAQRHPGVELEALLKLARNDRPLADAIRRVQSFEVEPSSQTEVSIDRAQARAMDLGAPVIERSLRRTDSGLVQQIAAGLADLESAHGNNDGALAPRDLDHATPLSKKIVEAVYAHTGRRRLELDGEVLPLLPKVISEVARRGRDSKDPVLAELHRAAVEETVRELAGGYRDEVLNQGLAPTAFQASRGVVHATWSRIRKQVPDAFPEPGSAALTPERLEAVAALYRQLLDGELTTTGFYKRAGIGAGQLQLLQQTDLERFPRQEDAPFWKTVTGRRNVELGPRELRALSKAYKAELVTGRTTRKAFEREHGISHGRLSQLQQSRPAEFPPIGRWDRDYTDRELAVAVGARALELWNADVLIKASDLIAGLNRDPELSSRFGKISLTRYEQVRSRHPKLFPALRDPDLIVAKLADEVRELLADQLDLTPRQITSLMKERHPSFKLSRVYQIREKYPELIPQVAPPKLGSDRRRADAERLAAEMKRHPDRTIKEIAEAWSAKTPRMSRDYLHRLRKDFQAELFSVGEIQRSPRTLERSSLPFAELYALAIRVAPPGTTQRTMILTLNQLLEERGLPPYDSQKPPSSLMNMMALRHGTPEEQSARITSQVVAEYARAAKKDTSGEDILKAVLRDYPSIDQQKLSTYVNLWSKKPADFPAIAGFVSRGKLQLSGRGEKIPTPRFIGGWDVERALLEPAKKDRLLAAELASATQFAKISTSLPMLDELVAELDGKKPLAHTNILWVTHLLGTSFPLANALHAAGAKMASTIVVGTPYGTNDAVKDTFAQAGYDVRKPELSERSYRQTVERAVADMVKRHRKNHEPVVVLDDGGLVTEILHKNPAYKDVLGAFKIVEQTTRGITAAEAMDVRTPIVNVARSRTKALEGEMIGRSVAAKLMQGLERLGKSVAGVKVTVTGYGVVGRSIARALKEAGAIVTVVEPSSARAAEASGPPHFFAVATKAKALKGAQIVIGATGERSLTLEDLARLPAGAIVASASSKQLEIDLAGLAAAADRRELLPADSPLVKLPTARYRLGGKELTVLGDGWPLNFDGDVEDLPPEEIQVTRAVMFAGALQAARLKAHHVEKQRIIALDPDLDEQLHDRYRELEAERTQLQPIGDPSRWMDVIRDLAKKVALSLDG